MSRKISYVVDTCLDCPMYLKNAYICARTGMEIDKENTIPEECPLERLE